MTSKFNTGRDKVIYCLLIEKLEISFHLQKSVNEFAGPYSLYINSKKLAGLKCNWSVIQL